MEDKVLRGVLGHAPVGFAYHKVLLNEWGKPEDYILTDFNSAFEEITGFKREDLLGKRLTEVIPGVKKSHFEWVNLYHKAVLTGEKQEFICCLDSLGRWYRISVFASENENLVAVFQDISDEMERIKTLEEQSAALETLTRAEREVEEQLKMFIPMFKKHSVAMLITEPVSGRIVNANQAACAFYGYTIDEFRNMYIRDITLMPEEDFKKLRFMVLKKEVRNFTTSHRMKNGEVRVVDVYPCLIDCDSEELIFSIIIDATEREKYKEELCLEKERQRITFLSICDGVITTDEKGQITAMNRAAVEITGLREEEIMGKPFSQVVKLVDEKTDKDLGDVVERVLREGMAIAFAEYTTFVTGDGGRMPLAGSVSPIKDSKGQIFGVVIIFRDITEERAWREKILSLSYHDSLTGLYNRRYMEEEMKRLDLARELPLTVLMADVNGLKLANDVFGHEEGDKLLKKATEILKGSLRKKDIIARWGGDEFLVLLRNTTAENAERVIGRIRDRCLNAVVGKTHLSIAMGYAVMKDGSMSLEQVVKEAEEIMYRRKLMESKNYRNALIDTLLSTLIARGLENREHSDRVRNYCLAMGQEMRLSPKAMDELVLLATLHDIGKVGIRESILQKRGDLTEEDWQELKKHPEIGCRIAQNTPELAAIAEYILSHHERWDGKGFPRGLREREIPLLCRILAVAHAYEVMTASGAYPRALSRDEAIAEIKANAGLQFDPNIVNIFLEVMKKFRESEEGGNSSPLQLT